MARRAADRALLIARSWLSGIAKCVHVARTNSRAVRARKLAENSGMNWRLKSFVQAICANVPGGGFLYHQIQRCAGNLRDPSFLSRLQTQAAMARRLRDRGVAIRGMEVMEVGSGWIPLVPIGFWICGAARIRTFDLNRYLSPQLTSRALHWISEHREFASKLWGDLVAREDLQAALDVIERLRDHPIELLKHAGIDYHAPADAGATGLPDGSVDLHISVNVFEHVTVAALQSILREAQRVLGERGMALHHVDPSDHFAHADSSLLPISFLRFDEQQWRHLAGNRFGFHNRLRDNDFRRLFEEAGLEMIEAESTVDLRSIRALRDGFPLASSFHGRDFEDLCRKNLIYLAKSQVVPC
jgi:hypothetical protein